MSLWQHPFDRPAIGVNFRKTTKLIGQSPNQFSGDDTVGWAISRKGAQDRTPELSWQTRVIQAGVSHIGPDTAHANMYLSSQEPASTVHANGVCIGLKGDDSRRYLYYYNGSGFMTHHASRYISLWVGVRWERPGNNADNPRTVADVVQLVHQLPMKRNSTGVQVPIASGGSSTQRTLQSEAYQSSLWHCEGYFRATSGLPTSAPARSGDGANISARTDYEVTSLWIGYKTNYLDTILPAASNNVNLRLGIACHIGIERVTDPDSGIIALKY